MSTFTAFVSGCLKKSFSRSAPKIEEPEPCCSAAYKCACLTQWCAGTCAEQWSLCSEDHGDHFKGSTTLTWPVTGTMCLTFGLRFPKPQVTLSYHLGYGRDAVRRKRREQEHGAGQQP